MVQTLYFEHGVLEGLGGPLTTGFRPINVAELVSAFEQHSCGAIRWKLPGRMPRGSWFMTLAETRQIRENRRREYNESRPHRALGERTPNEFAPS